MLKNNNMGAVKRLSFRSLKYNRTRNLFAILAVVLTTFMFTTVFSIGYSLTKNMNIMLIRQQGTKASITLENPDKEQIKQAKKAANLNAAGIRIPVGTLSGENKKVEISLDYYDETEFEENFKPAVSDIEGSYPVEEDEIMVSRAALDALKIEKPVKGMEIVLVRDSSSKKFVLSGWFTDYVFYSGAYQGFVSEKYVDGLGLTVEKDGILCLSAKAGKQDDLSEELLSVDLRNGQKFDVGWDVQKETRENMLVAVVTVGIIGLIIVLSGYLLIYNVMYISVTKDIRFYGMLKTIGTSPSQIKKIVKMQTARLSLYGIPIGILLGTFASFVVVPYAISAFRSGVYSEMPTDIRFNPFIYISTILFAFVTVAVSSRKPAKLASKVSAVEALKYNGQNAVKIRAKKSTDGGKIYKMAFRNVFREKKRAFLVFASLFMGTMAFLSVDTFIGSMKLENYIDYYLTDDYTIYTRITADKDIQGAERLADDISKIDGVTDVSVNHNTAAILKFDEELFKPFLDAVYFYDLEDDEDYYKRKQEMIDSYKEHTEGELAYSAPTLAVSSEMIERYNERVDKKIDIDRFEKGEVCIIGDVSTKEQADNLEGKIITLYDESHKDKINLEVGSCMISDKAYDLSVGYLWAMDGAPNCIIISDKAMEKICKKPSVNSIIINCEQDKESSVTSRIKQLTKQKAFIINTEIKSELISGFKSSMTTLDIMCGGISMILILIGVINFINVMLTGVFTRRGELAVMESIGMTKRQVKKMLTYEGAYYGAVTLALILVFGNVIIYVIADFASKIADYAVFHYPIALMCVIAVFIMAICMAVPSIVYRMLSKESVTERLRK